MNTEHHAKTLASLDTLIVETASAVEKAMLAMNQNRTAFSDLLSPPGITYYRAQARKPEEGHRYHATPLTMLNYWLIVIGHHLTTPIRHKGLNYYSMGIEGPGPEEENILRGRVVAVDHCLDCHDDYFTTYFLLVEEIPESELP